MFYKASAKRLSVGACMALGLLCTQSVWAKDHNNGPEQLKAAQLSATCAACHGTEGKNVNGSAVSGLSNLSVDYIKTNMRWFKTGERPATLMHQLAKGYTDEQIDLIANYLGKKD